MIHLHITAWIIAIILLFVTNSMYKKGKGTEPHMILRVMYLIILFLGIMLFFDYANYSFELIFKSIACLWVIVSMDLISFKAIIGGSVSAGLTQFWIALIIALILVIGRLTMSVQLFG